MLPQIQCRDLGNSYKFELERVTLHHKLTSNLSNRKWALLLLSPMAQPSQLASLVHVEQSRLWTSEGDEAEAERGSRTFFLNLLRTTAGLPQRYL